MTAAASSPSRKVLFLRNIRGLETPSGAEIYLSYLARDLPNLGWQPEFLLATNPRRDHGPILELLKSTGAKVQCCDVRSPYSTADLRSARALIAQRKPDILHCMDHRSDTLGALMRPRIPCPVVATFQGWTGFAPGSWRWRLYGALDKRALSRLDLVFIDSRDMARNLGAFAESDRIRHVPNGIDIARFSGVEVTRPKDAPPTFAVIARYNPNKGQMDLLKAAKTLSATHPDARFVLMGQAASGDEGYEASLRAFVQEHRLENVIFHTPVPHDELPKYLAQYDAVVAPSHVEGLSLIVLEAMVAGLPIVCYASGALREVLRDGETALMAPPGDTDALARALARVADGDPDVAGIAAAGQALAVENYGTQRMARQVVAGYGEVLARSERN